MFVLLLLAVLLVVTPAGAQTVFDVVPPPAAGTFSSTVIFADNSQFSATGLALSPSGTLTLPDGSTWRSSGLLFPPTSTLTLPDASTWSPTDLRFSGTVNIRGPDSSTWTSNGLSMGRPLFLSNGTATSPGLAFSNEAGTGVYRAGATDLRVSLSGSEALRLFVNGGVPTLGAAVGTSATFATVGGTICVNTTEQATTGTALEILATCEVIGNALARDHQMIRVRAWATTAATADNRLFGVYFGATHCGRFVGALNDGLIIVDATIIRTGASTQECIGTAFGQGAAGDDHNLTFGTPAEDLSASATVYAKASGDNAGAVTFQGMYVEVMN